MTRMTLASRICCLCLATSFAAPAALAGANLAPHRAYYILEPERLDDKGGITSIAGKLAYEITGNACDGYAVSYRIANRYVQGEGSPQTMDVQLTSFESGDGKELDMRQKQFVNGMLDTETRVKAKLPGQGGQGSGELEGKETKSFEIDPAAVFPTAFQRQLLQSAENGESRATALVFEGSDDQKASRAVSFIGAKRSTNAIAAGADAATLSTLNKLPFWPVTVSYFDATAKGDESPTYSARFNMLENGVSTDLILDYGTYSLKGRLEKIELLKPEACN
jgi:EipB-like